MLRLRNFFELLELVIINIESINLHTIKGTFGFKYRFYLLAIFGVETRVTGLIFLAMDYREFKYKTSTFFNLACHIDGSIHSFYNTIGYHHPKSGPFFFCCKIRFT